MGTKKKNKKTIKFEIDSNDNQKNEVVVEDCPGPEIINIPKGFEDGLGNIDLTKLTSNQYISKQVPAFEFQKNFDSILNKNYQLGYEYVETKHLDGGELLILFKKMK